MKMAKFNGDFSKPDSILDAIESAVQKTKGTPLCDCLLHKSRWQIAVLLVDDYSTAVFLQSLSTCMACLAKVTITSISLFEE